MLRIDPSSVIKLLTAGKEQSERAGVAYIHQLRWKDLCYYTGVGLNLQRILSQYWQQVSFSSRLLWLLHGGIPKPQKSLMPSDNTAG